MQDREQMERTRSRLTNVNMRARVILHGALTRARFGILERFTWISRVLLSRDDLGRFRISRVQERDQLPSSRRFSDFPISHPRHTRSQQYPSFTDIVNARFITQARSFPAKRERTRAFKCSGGVSRRLIANLLELRKLRMRPRKRPRL